jgi:hypothetical protein
MAIIKAEAHRITANGRYRFQSHPCLARDCAATDARSRRWPMAAISGAGGHDPQKFGIERKALTRIKGDLEPVFAAV